MILMIPRLAKPFARSRLARLVSIFCGLVSAAFAQGTPEEWVWAPELDLATADGEKTKLESLRGSIVVLYFFRFG